MYDDRSTTNADAADFVRSVTGVLVDHWGDAVAAGAEEVEGRLVSIRRLAAAQGWFQLAAADAVDFLAGLQQALGAAGCTLPVTDAYACSLALPDVADDVAAGDVVPVVRVARGTGTVDPAIEVVAEAVPDATHLVTVDLDSHHVALQAITASAVAPGLPAPSWRRLTLTAPTTTVAAEADVVEHVLAVMRIGTAARAVGAASEAHRMAVTHATERRQFGRAIGAFGAVQQRTARAQIESSAGAALVSEAAAALAAGAPTGPLSAALAARFVADTAVDVLAAAQHTLGAIGYFEEHPLPWLFRSVHVDVSLLRGPLADAGTDSVAHRLLAPGAALPHLDLGSKAEQFREEVHAMLEGHRTGAGFDVEGVRAEMEERHWFALGWPEADGGLGASVEEQVVLHEELKYAGGPVDRAMSAAMLIGHSLLRHGTGDQKKEFLPLIRAGRMAFCLGYSEPEAGSDLASLRTRAVRDGNDWIIDGQKAWTTRGHTASHVWLAVRTDPEARPRHAGITIFLVPMDTPGITVQQHTALSGEISCTVFYDAVRVPDSARVGEVDGGWRVITDALAAERVVMGGVSAVLRRQFDELVALLRAEPDVDPVRRHWLGGMAARLQAARVLVLAATRSMEGDDARILGPMAAVLAGDLAESFGRDCLDLLGPTALLSKGAADALAEGRFESALRLAPMFVIGGGTNDIQRGIIARALGLPRE